MAGLAILLSALCLCALWTWIVVAGFTARIDEAIMVQAGAQRSGHPWLGEVAWYVTRTGDGVSRVVAGLAVAAALAFGGARRNGLWLAGVVIGGVLLSSAVKGIIDRPRPTIIPWLDTIGNASYPSGHAMGATVLGLALAMTFARGWVWGVALAYIMLVSISRIILGVHWPSDIVGGILMGCAWIATARLMSRNVGIVPA